MHETNIGKMNFKELRREVQLLRDELAVMKRSYEDILYNIDDDNLSVTALGEKKIMKEGISELEVGMDGIKMKVSKVYAVREYDGVGSPDDDYDKEYIYKDKAGLYYKYNFITEKWEEAETSEIESAFIQTEDGFVLNGAVVKITGDLITAGTIDGSAVSIGKQLIFKNAEGETRAKILIDDGATAPVVTISATNNRPIHIETDGNMELSGHTISINADSALDLSGCGKIEWGTNNPVNASL